jgi:hypothetical protein
MIASNFVEAWVSLVGSLAMIALILTAFGIMLGIVKPADALRRMGVIIGIVIVLMFIPGVLVDAWSGLSLWQKITLAAIGVGVWLWLRFQPQKK